MKTFEIPQYESEDEAFDAEFDGLEYADNFRFAEVGNDDEMVVYMEKMRKGCCGSRDTVVHVGRELSTGYKYYRLCLIGCNYGH
jgi:hypothetical protein